MAQRIRNLLAMWETWVRSLDWKDPLVKGKATHSSILAWRIHGLYSPWGHIESDMTEGLSLSLFPFGQRVHLGFPIRCYGNFLASPKYYLPNTHAKLSSLNGKYKRSTATPKFPGGQWVGACRLSSKLLGQTPMPFSSALWPRGLITGPCPHCPPSSATPWHPLFCWTPVILVLWVWRAFLLLSPSKSQLSNHSAECCPQPSRGKSAAPGGPTALSTLMDTAPHGRGHTWDFGPSVRHTRVLRERVRN